MENNITTFAPILIPTLNRYDHFKRCVESLSKCIHADKTELVIGLAYPPNEKYVEGWKKICDYVQKITGFAEVTILKREENYGVHRNIASIKEYASTKYDSFIFSEDDNEFSPNFLDFINKGLERYKDDPKVYAICGYNYPVDVSGYKHEYYYSHEFAAWGYGCWFKKQKEVFDIIQSPNYLINLYRDYPLHTYFKNNLKLMSLATRLGDGFLGDVYLTSYLHSRQVYTVFPTISKVRNWGHDGTGVNCSAMENELAKLYTNQIIDDNKISLYDNDIPMRIDSRINTAVQKFKTPSWKVLFLRLVLFSLIRVYSKIKR